jgi:hypothetical protein
MMSTAPQETATRQDDSKNPAMWIGDPDGTDTDQNPPMTRHDEEEPMEEPGYGHGV